MRADGAANRGSIAHPDVTLLEVACAKEATALRALALRLYVAALLAAALYRVALADGRLVGEVLNQVLFLPRAILRVTDLLPIAKAIAVPQIRVSEVVNGKRAVTPDTALRLARYFGTSAELWTGMQASYDLETARDRVGAEIEARIHPRAA